MDKKRIIVGMTGASGQIYGIRLLEALREREDVETHLVMSEWAGRTLEMETDYSKEAVEGLCDVFYYIKDLGAPISSGSFPIDGMVVTPCSMKTLSAIAHSYNENLLVRAADVTLKEKRPLVLAVRETPLHLGHIRLMAAAAECGATLFPPLPAFYNQPATLDDIVNHSVCRMLDLLGVKNSLARRWGC